MTSNPIAAVKLGGKAAILATLMATASFAQTTATEAPAEVTTMDAVEFPALTSVETDQEVIDSLSAQGYENVVVTRADGTLIVTGERGGLPTEMIFSDTDGTLVLVDGVEPVTTAPAPAATAPVAPAAGATVDPATSTDGDEPTSEAPDSANFSGQDQVPLDTPTASVEGDESDPVFETIPSDAVLPTPAEGETGIDADGGAETDGNEG
ncbi:MAG: hypothetical protein ACK41Y_06155 [Paracoccus hibiscisoli]|uniref:hypothetical protein n=1 Tax=Paracoccus hibiscisoli TaxID=2023261 RepID=UPI0039192119